MKTIVNNSIDPYYNLALEEYLLKKVDIDDDLFYLWVNDKSVIVGRNQNPFVEVNMNYAFNNHIDIVRRSTGGGTVYHDTGNINFTFITSKVSERLHNYKFFLSPIILALNKIGIKAHFEPKTHIYVGENKISGNAQTFYKNKMIHHGTLLFDVDSKHLDNVLSETSVIKTHAVASNHSKVVNLRELSKKNWSISDFMNYIISEVTDENTNLYTLTKSQIREIQNLSESKYRTWEWTFGQTPKFTINKEQYTIEVTNGFISESSHYKDLLIGTKFDRASLIEQLGNMDLKENMIKVLFN